MFLAVWTAARPATPPPSTSTAAADGTPRESSSVSGALIFPLAPPHSTRFSSRYPPRIRSVAQSRTLPPTRTPFAGGTLPAAVIWPAKKRPKTLDASTTAR
eukprot:6385797-Prymnesium_polylepis.1